jgi:hypothetical protein
MIKFGAVLFAALTSAQLVSAAVVGGGVTDGSGTFQMIDTNGLTVGQNNQQSNNLFAFDEVQNVRLKADLTLNQGGTIKAGTRVSSHYVFFDPQRYTRQQGFIDFGTNILGIATKTSTLALTDFLGLSTVNYLAPRLRGLERPDIVGVDGADPTRLLLDWKAGNPGDYIRVITASVFATVPLPASGLVLLSGLFVLGAIRRRKTR